MWAIVTDGNAPTLYADQPTDAIVNQVVIPACPDGKSLIPFVEPGGTGKLMWTQANGFFRVPPVLPVTMQMQALVGVPDDKVTLLQLVQALRSASIIPT